MWLKVGGIEMDGSCPACGAPLEQGSCPYCGYEVPKETQHSTMEREDVNPQTVIHQDYEQNIVYPNEQRYTTLCSPKSKAVTLITCILFGYCGLHRFYAGKIGTGIIWFLTAGCFGIGYIYDIITIAMGTFTDGAGLPIKN